MEDWGKTRKEEYPGQDEYDISSIDQEIFDDPVLLLEYLERYEAQKKAKEHEKSLMHSADECGGAESKHDSLSNSDTIRATVIYGYEIVRGEIRINQEQASAISEIISLHEAGYSCSQIEYLLGSTKHRTITGKKLYLSAIQAIVKNKKVYEGETGYPSIIHKSKQSDSRTKTTVTDNYSSVGVKQVVTQKTSGSDDYSSPYWEAIDKMRKSIEQRKVSYGQKNVETDKSVYRSIDDFLTFIKSKDVPIKDNRSKDGCVWVRAEVAIADIMAHAVIKGRGFRYSPKCKAFNGEPGWYY